MAEKNTQIVDINKATIRVRTPIYPILSFPGISLQNFWSKIVERQNGEFQRSEAQLQSEFAVIREHLHSAQPDASALIQLASYIVERVNKQHMPRGTALGLSSAPSSTADHVQRGRCPTPKLKRTCMECNVYIDDTVVDATCFHCSFKNNN
ncbi:hypothetical protein [Limnohabitans sp.]